MSNKGCALAIVGVVGILVAATLSTLQWFAEEMADLLLQFATFFLWGLLGVGLGAATLIAFLVIRKQWTHQWTQKDGSFPLREYKMPGGARLLVDPNSMVGAAGVFHPEYGWAEIEPTAGWAVQKDIRALVQTTRHLQASSPGDDVYMDKFGSLARPGKAGIANAATGKFLSGGWGPRTTTPEPEAPPPPPALPLLNLRSAYEQSTPERFILGQNPESGKLAVFNPVESVHAGIIGVTGTRKTTSVGYTLAGQALRHGYHLITLDPKGGVDWRAFANHGEWVGVDPSNYADAIEGLWREHDTRHRTVIRAGVNNLRDLNGQAPPPVLVILEEYGDMIRQLRRTDRKQADQVDDWLDRMLRLSRMTSIHLVFIDQYPEEWSNQAIGGTKAKYIFQLGPNQGAKVEEYHAGKLPDHSIFLHRKEAYTVFDAQPRLKSMLATTPRSPLADRPLLVSVGEGSGSFGEGWGGVTVVDPPPVERPNAPNARTEDPGPSDRQRRVWAYLDKHPDAGPTKVERETGVAKSYAHELIARWKNGEAELVEAPPPVDLRKLDVNALADALAASDFDTRPAIIAELNRRRTPIKKGRAQ